ncbi:MAG: RNA 2',3'-cyclic phosphodiesterase [Gammaproteobacteria bacterium]|nr:RNA 2',3'-cyclic phosphodiesterase [Gammaproteobacteria bacterium]
MRSPSVIRIFFAVELAQAMKEKIGEYVSQLKKNAKSHSIKWTKKANLHITLQFLGEIKGEHVPTIVDNVKNQLKESVVKTHINLGEVTLFPNPFRPRVIVFDITPQDELAKISERVGNGIRLSQYDTDTRPFHGHLTLGRLKHPNTNLRFLSKVDHPAVGYIEVNEVVLFRSDPVPDGTEYTVLERIELAEERCVNLSKPG